MVKNYKEKKYKSINSTYIRRTQPGQDYWFNVNKRGAMIRLLKAAYIDHEEAVRIFTEFDSGRILAEEVFADSRDSYEGLGGIVIFIPEGAKTNTLGFSKTITEIE